MKLHILTLNMQGLCAPERITKVRRLIHNLKPRIDLFCGEEHHLRDNNLPMLPLKLWKFAKFLMVCALNKVVVERNPEAVFDKGGLLIAIGPKLIPSIVNKGILPN